MRCAGGREPGGPLTLLSTLASTYEHEHLDGNVVLYDYAPPQREYEKVGLKRVAALGRAVILSSKSRQSLGPSDGFIVLSERAPDGGAIAKLVAAVGISLEASPWLVAGRLTWCDD